MAKHNNNEGGCDRNPARPSAATTTTFVQLADPSNFRAVVQKLTGASTTIEQPLASTTHVRNHTSTYSEDGHDRKPGQDHHNKAQLIHERRKLLAGRNNNKLEINVLNKVEKERAAGRILGQYNAAGDVVSTAASPVSTLDHVCGNRSPGTPIILEDQLEEKAIAEKGFYLHPSPIGGSEPELLVLFPLI